MFGDIFMGMSIGGRPTPSIVHRLGARIPISASGNLTRVHINQKFCKIKPALAELCNRECQEMNKQEPAKAAKELEIPSYL